MLSPIATLTADLCKILRDAERAKTASARRACERRFWEIAVYHRRAQESAV